MDIKKEVTTIPSRYNESMPESVWLTLLTFSQSSLIIGSFIGSVSFKFLLNYLTPKQIIQLSHVTNIIGILLMSFGCGLGGSYEAFIIGRLLVGIPCGVSYACVPATIAELSIKSRQNFWQTINGVSISLGMFIGPTLAYPKILGSPTLWPVLMAVGAIPSVLYLASSFKIPETPYFLMRRNKKEEALNSLKKLRDSDQAALDEELNEIEEEINSTATSLGIMAILKKKQYRNQFIAVTAVFCNYMFVGTNHIVFYSTIVFVDGGVPQDTADLALIGMFGAQFIAACFGSKLVERFGGRLVTISGNIMVILALSLFTASQATRDRAPEVMPIVSIISIGICLVVLIAGINVAIFSLLGSLTIEPTRATCFAYASIFFWVSSWFVGFIPPYLQIAFGAYSMVIWIVCSVLFLIYMLIFLPETKGKTTEEIQSKFRGKVFKSSIRSTRPLNEL